MDMVMIKWTMTVMFILDNQSLWFTVYGNGKVLFNGEVVKRIFNFEYKACEAEDNKSRCFFLPSVINFTIISGQLFETGLICEVFRPNLERN